MELERIKQTPFHRLQRQELRARKLLERFHDKRDGEESLRVGLSVGVYDFRLGVGQGEQWWGCGRVDGALINLH